ncbi:hypothetical protein, variant [Batrachochytrium dendrobatidis JEL423]|uniref:UBC core domain-containing protein n=1 Tax=Batrachochytrium dendrobatidis (strain JEL423) TaxID=403673 RepID=A0A177WXN1_BATDL|nr:hypothetical protein, variant [Batrachochytrium dendrobatidis JEL423]
MNSAQVIVSVNHMISRVFILTFCGCKPPVSSPNSLLSKPRMMSGLASKRLVKELRDLKTKAPVGISIKDPEDSLTCWYISIDGAPGTLYEGEVFTLQFKFSKNYPLESPEVIFVNQIPVHPHIYSNGHICLSILYDQWSPALTVGSVCLSLQSMLSSCTKKVKSAGLVLD